MKSQLRLLSVSLGAWLISTGTLAAAGFTPLVTLPAPAIVESSPDYPGGAFSAGNLIDGNERSQYSSASKGTMRGATRAARTRPAAIMLIEASHRSTSMSPTFS